MIQDKCIKIYNTNVIMELKNPLPKASFIKRRAQSNGAMLVQLTFYHMNFLAHTKLQVHKYRILSPDSEIPSVNQNFQIDKTK